MTRRGGRADRRTRGECYRRAAQPYQRRLPVLLDVAIAAPRPGAAEVKLPDVLVRSAGVRACPRAPRGRSPSRMRGPRRRGRPARSAPPRGLLCQAARAPYAGAASDRAPRAARAPARARRRARVEARTSAPSRCRASGALRPTDNPPRAGATRRAGEIVVDHVLGDLALADRGIEVLVHAQALEHLAALGHQRHAERTRCGGQFSMRVASNCTAPSVTRASSRPRKPEIARRSWSCRRRCCR